MKLGTLAAITAAATIAVGASTLQSEAATFEYNFTNISGNSAIDAAIGEAQMTMQVSDACGALCVGFSFFNSGPAASSITQIYWEDVNPTILASLGTITSGAGTSFSWGAAPPNLPAGNTIGFAATDAADPNAPVQPNGINPGETASFEFGLAAGSTLANVIAQLDAGTLRVGFHVQGYDGGGSESFVNDGKCIPGSFDCPKDVNVVPVPASLPLLASMLFGVGVYSRVRRRKDAV